MRTMCNRRSLGIDRLDFEQLVACHGVNTLIGLSDLNNRNIWMVNILVVNIEINTICSDLESKSCGTVQSSDSVPGILSPGFAF